MEDFDYAERPMVEITLEELAAFSDRSNTLVTVDAPLFGTVLIFNGRVLNRGTYVDPEKVGNAIGFPPPSQIVSEATRFWIQDDNGIRHRKTREEMARLIQTPARLAMKA
jgi:hypothetical protein